MIGIDQSSLRYLYVEQRLTVRAIADGFGLHPEIVSEALARWHITRPFLHRTRRSAPNVPFDEATLRDLYLNQQHTIQEIATHYAIRYPLVLAALKYWQIPRHRPGPRPKGCWPPENGAGDSN